MYDPPSKLSYETTPLAQDHRNQEIASAQGPPPPYNLAPSSSKRFSKKVELLFFKNDLYR